jgi:hypothetical protein
MRTSSVTPTSSTPWGGRGKCLAVAPTCTSALASTLCKPGAVRQPSCDSHQIATNTDSTESSSKVLVSGS